MVYWVNLIVWNVEFLTNCRTGWWSTRRTEDAHVGVGARDRGAHWASPHWEWGTQQPIEALKARYTQHPARCFLCSSLLHYVQFPFIWWNREVLFVLLKVRCSQNISWFISRLPSHGPNVIYLDYSLKASVETFLSRQYRSLWMPLNSYRIQWIQRKDKTSSTVNKNDSMYWFRHKGYILDTSVIQRETYSSSFNISKDIFWEISWNMRCQAMRLWL